MEGAAAALVLGVRVVGGGGAALHARLVQPAPRGQRDTRRRRRQHFPPVTGRRQAGRRQAPPRVRHLARQIQN